jgi:hypothetical protein
MGPSGTIIRDLEKLFPGWVFHGLESDGLLGGLITRISSSCTLINCFSIVSSLCREVYSKELDRSFFVLNLYGPYEGKEACWSRLFL